MLLTLYSFDICFPFLTKGNNDTKGEKEKSECDDCVTNNPGILTQENIQTARDSKGLLIVVPNDDTDSNSNSNDDSKLEEEHLP